ncbi:uncharacterized protein PGTG_10324 [Puccinia graminis f. sp. tritici CRL 75-36-700-3]|uniref:Uncharacterized protein n=1 Tax=Puccinia graminis f. sp. tritici (strain CRL 75-36-700-3 / race SCCL) TaxID=418459 RepID=E3KKM8_PUCGT|nr:uncharacterized protein PGTG_10324 [Puccinia graminis f. sp. tritici CRL 75-36-700-3]EFP84853.2 hypothetical protein PGTG_10324 [Puccinia graminis f. sp. tritici CRL 75-36-700-3]
MRVCALRSAPVDTGIICVLGVGFILSFRIALYCKPEDHSRSALIPVGHRATEVGSSTTTKKPTLREDTGLLLGPVWAVSTVYLGLDPQAGTLVANHDKLAM